MVALDMVKEYALIGYLKLLPHTRKKLPDEWVLGDVGTVVLIPGLHETNFFLYSVGNFLNQHGYRILTIPEFDSLEPVGQIYTKLEKLVQSLDASNIILVSHSKGGIVAKYFLDNSNQSHRIKYSVSLATPYLGSVFAILRFHNLHELASSSNLIKEVSQQDAHVAKVINLYPKFDNHVIPNKNLLLKGAKNIQINVNGHTRILVCEETYTEIIKALANN
ncbi:MAG: hypothetical protein RLY61_377 [Candidatus Parcubacteria bacterium]|jgi:hypothetical protein